jgi:proteic killer suppression protein
MIGSFKHRGLKRLYARGGRSGVRPDLVGTVEEILTVLDKAATPQALNLPGYRLHPLKGEVAPSSKRNVMRQLARTVKDHNP